MSGLRRLETQADGWALAVDTLALLRDAGPEKCRTAPPAILAGQTDVLAMAMLQLKERGTCDAVIGFAAILCDAIGTRSFEPMPELYAEQRAAGRLRTAKVRRIAKRMKRGGLWLAALALQREELKRASGELASPGALTAPDTTAAR